MRKLAIGAFSLSAAIFASNYLLPRSAVLYAAALCALCGAGVLAVRLRSLKGLVIALLCASCGFLVYIAHDDLTVERAHELAGTDRVLRFRLVAAPERREGYSRAEVRLHTRGLPRLNTVLYDYDGFLDACEDGDLVYLRTRLLAADLRFGERTDRYTAKNVYLTGTVKSRALRVGKSWTLRALASAASDRISERIDRLYSGETAAFLKALTVGDRRELNRRDALFVALSRAGMMHVVAVSGMHVSYLVSFLRMLLGKSRRSSLFCLALVWAFVLVSGLPASAARAAFMQTMLLLAPLFGREDDPLTSLSAALAFLLLLNPFAACDIGLQLSFAAMLGNVLFAERMRDAMLRPFGEGRAAALMKVPISSVASSLSVLVFTLPLTACFFGFAAVLSPLSNLLCLFAVPYCFVGGYLSCLLSLVPPLGRAAAFAVALPVRYILAVCRAIASLDCSAVYLPETLMLVWIAALYLTLALLFLLRAKPLRKILISTLSAVVSLCLIQTGFRLYADAPLGTFAVLDVGQGQCVCAFAGERAVVVDCGTTSYAEYNAGDCAAAYLRSRGVRRIDALIFTHLHADHANGAERLCNLMPVGTIILPEQSDDSEEQLTRLLRCTLAHRIPVEKLRGTQSRQYGALSVTLYGIDGSGEGNERCMPVLLSVGDYELLTTGDSPAEREEELTALAELSAVEALVVGHHGSKDASSERLLAEIGGGKAIISAGKNSYGLPAEETLERLARFGYTVLRTDLDGDVELRVYG